MLVLFKLWLLKAFVKINLKSCFLKIGLKKALHSRSFFFKKNTLAAVTYTFLFTATKSLFYKNQKSW